jgi:hypothetical protein
MTGSDSANSRKPVSKTRNASMRLLPQMYYTHSLHND